MRTTALIAACLLSVAFFCVDVRSPAFRADQIRGAWLAPTEGTPLDSPRGLDALRRLRDLGASHVAVGPEIIMPDYRKPALHFGEQDGKLRAFLRAAKSAGLGVFLLPRIESPMFFASPNDPNARPPWRGDIKMESDAAWAEFHDAYAKAIAHYGALGREEGVAVLGIGLEYRQTVVAHPDAWRRIAAAAKSAFGGPITYSANWDDYDRIAWWDAVDYVGIGAYFELLEDGLPDDQLASKPLPPGSLRALLKTWDDIKKQLAGVSKRFDRPIFFTEVGYTTFADTAYYPWMWQQAHRAIDPSQQAQCYRALIRALAPEPWWKGVCFWRFYTEPEALPPWDYSPQNHEAEWVLRDSFSRVRSE